MTSSLSVVDPAVAGGAMTATGSVALLRFAAAVGGVLLGLLLKKIAAAAR